MSRDHLQSLGITQQGVVFKDLTDFEGFDSERMDRVIYGRLPAILPKYQHATGGRRILAK